MKNAVKAESSTVYFFQYTMSNFKEQIGNFFSQKNLIGQRYKIYLLLKSVVLCFACLFCHNCFDLVCRAMKWIKYKKLLVTTACYKVAKKKSVYENWFRVLIGTVN